MKVKALVSMCMGKTSIGKGHIINLEDKLAKKLVKDGLVVAMEEEKAPKRKRNANAEEVKEDVK